MYLLFGGFMITHLLVIVGHRNGIIWIRRVDTVRLLVIFVCFYRIVSLEIEIPDQDRIPCIRRIFVGQLFQFIKCFLRLFNLHVQLVFLRRERFVHPDSILQIVESVDGFANLSGLGQRFGEIVVQFHFAGVSLYKFAINLGRFTIHADVE